MADFFSGYAGKDKLTHLKSLLNKSKAGIAQEKSEKHHSENSEESVQYRMYFKYTINYENIVYDMG